MLESSKMMMLIKIIRQYNVCNVTIWCIYVRSAIYNMSPDVLSADSILINYNSSPVSVAMESILSINRDVTDSQRLGKVWDETKDIFRSRSLNTEDCWNSVDWALVHQRVKTLRSRIYAKTKKAEISKRKSTIVAKANDRII